jgi:hypothetical protein
MAGALPTSLSVREHARTLLREAVAPGVVLYLLGSSLRFAVAAVVGFVVLNLSMDAATAVVGDYADNVVLGLLTLAFTGYLIVSGFPPALAVGGPVGGWLVFDGLQHLRHGECRDELSLPYSHDGGPVTGFLRAMIARLLEPFRL